MDVGDRTELHCHGVFAHALDAVDVDMRAQREHERIETEAVAAELEHAIAVIDAFDDADAQLDASSADESRGRLQSPTSCPVAR